jgi:hypothetical protein
MCLFVLPGTAGGVVMKSDTTVKLLEAIQSLYFSKRHEHSECNGAKTAFENFKHSVEECLFHLVTGIQKQGRETHG